MKSHYATISLAFGAAIALTFLLPEASESDQSQSIDLQSKAAQPLTQAIPLELGPRLAKVEDMGAGATDIQPLALIDLGESGTAVIGSSVPESAAPADGMAGVDIAADEPTAEAPAVEEPADDMTGEWLTYVIQPGDSLSAIFSRHDFDAALLHRLVQADGKNKTLSRIRPGQELQFFLPEAGDAPTKLWVRLDPVKSVRFNVTDVGIERQLVEAEIEIRVESAQGRITQSLYNAAKEAGLPDKIIMDLANIYAFDVDFARQIRPNDRFSVIYEAEYLDDQRIGTGKILAAEFVNKGESMVAIGFESQGFTDYYDEQGRSRKKAFVRTPLNFRRISSVFSNARKHPILERTRPHRGVDYAAPTGTPVWATGNGVVKRKEYHRGYGNVIYLKHGKRYTTVYAHLSRFKKGLNVGDRVDQGEVIGYVGSTGLSTGPHLHYEFRIDDKHVDPLSLKLPAADPLSGEELARFRSATKPMLAKLDGMRELVVATRKTD